LFLLEQSCDAFHYSKAPLATTSIRTKARRENNHDNRRIQTSLNYNSEESVDSSSNRWWKSILTIPSSNTETTSTVEPERDSQQESVDAYLEFLDRRYRRIHSNEDEQAKKNQQLQQQQPLSKPKSFSAMDWLMNGSTTAEHHHAAAAAQHEDALYVLGVAGLASQKLLQKHHLVSPATAAETTSTKTTMDDAIEVNAEEDNVKDLPSHVFIKNVLVPLIRAIYIVQRRKQLLLQSIQSRITKVVSKVVEKTVRPFTNRFREGGPKAIIESLLELGGGKRNIAVTFACAYATVVVLQPLIQQAVAEGSVRPLRL
jgi:hypothetical protein